MMLTRFLSFCAPVWATLGLNKFDAQIGIFCFLTGLNIVSPCEKVGEVLSKPKIRVFKLFLSEIACRI